MKQRTNYLKKIIVLKDSESLRSDPSGRNSAQSGSPAAPAENGISACSAEAGTLYIVSPDSDLKVLSENGIPFVVYVDTLAGSQTGSGNEYDCTDDAGMAVPGTDGTDMTVPTGEGNFCDGAKYVLEGEGEFDEDDFDPEELEKIYRRLAKIPWDILETDRCVIKETSLDDLDEFYEIYADPDITRFTEDLMERSEEKKYTENYRDLIYEIYGHGIWTVIKKDTNEIIGRAGLDERAGFDTPELGFVIGKPWQNRGYAYEVCSAILSWASENGITEIMSLAEKENAAAAKLLKKLGFFEENAVTIGTSELVRFNFAVK